MQFLKAAAAALLLLGCATAPRVHEEQHHLIYDTGGVVVWVWPCFPSDDCKRDEYERRAATGLGELLKSRRLSGERLYRALPGGAEAEVARGRRLLPTFQPLDALTRYDGPLVKVLILTEHPDKTGHTVVLRLASTASRAEDGWGSMDYLEVTVTNPDVAAGADRARFFQGARVVDVRYTGTEL